MLRLIFGLFFLTACSLGTVKTGGDKPFTYDPHRQYTATELAELSPLVVTTAKKNPPVGKIDELFAPNLPDIKRIGIVVFETQLQPVLGGLSGKDKVYLSDQGRQLMTEMLFQIWTESLPLLKEQKFSFVPLNELKKTKSFSLYGQEVEDQIKSDRYRLAPDDIFFIPPGKTISSALTTNPRGMRDLSLLMVPASELMSGPKFSEHAKYFINDVMKELQLDAVLVIKSEIFWTSGRVEKNTGNVIPEELVIDVTSSTLISFSQYHDRLKASGLKDFSSKVNVCFRSYKGKINLPIHLPSDEEDQSFNVIEKNLLNPLMKSYKDLSQMMMDQILSDLESTH
jgi:hypothetical protein